MNFTLSYSPVPTFYNIDDHHLDVWNCCPDLGVTITHNLSWSDYIQTIVSKAYRMLCFIRRSFMSGPTHIRRELHVTLLRSQLTYCSQIWRPHVLKKIKLLETVQRRATKWNIYLTIRLVCKQSTYDCPGDT